MRCFIRNYTLLGLFVFLLTTIFGWYTLPDRIPVIISGLTFSWLMGIGSGLIVGYTFTKTHKFFMLALVGGMIAKLILAPIYILIMAKLYPNLLAVSTSVFLFFYLLFTGFEVYQLIRNLRPHLKKDTKN